MKAMSAIEPCSRGCRKKKGGSADEVLPPGLCSGMFLLDEFPCEEGEGEEDAEEEAEGGGAGREVMDDCGDTVFESFVKGSGASDCDRESQEDCDCREGHDAE